LPYARRPADAAYYGMRIWPFVTVFLAACGGRVDTAPAPTSDAEVDAIADTGCDLCIDSAPPPEPASLILEPREPTAIVDPLLTTPEPAVVDFVVRRDPGSDVTVETVFTLSDPSVGSFVGPRFVSTVVRADESRWSVVTASQGGIRRDAALVVLGLAGATDPDPTHHGMLVLGTGCGDAKTPLGDRFVFVAPNDGDFKVGLEGEVTKPTIAELVLGAPRALSSDPACGGVVKTMDTDADGVEDTFVGAKKGQRLCADLRVRNLKGPNTVVRFRAVIRDAAGARDLREVVYVVRETTCIGGR